VPPRTPERNTAERWFQPALVSFLSFAKYISSPGKLGLLAAPRPQAIPGRN
jgi:hypothetical protein